MHISTITFASVNFHSHANSVEPVHRTETHIASNHRVPQLVTDNNRGITVPGEGLKTVNSTCISYVKIKNLKKTI